METTKGLIETGLNSMLDNNPFLLLEDECNFVAWSQLTQFVPPQSVKNRILELQENYEGPFGDWNIQDLDDAEGALVNLDYFSVTVNTLPKKANSSQRYTAQELLDHIRKNINEFVNTGASRFEPFNEIFLSVNTGVDESQLWQSSNPLETVIGIDIPFDDGAVICSEYSYDLWRFSTLEAPWFGNHPVSGNREFGYNKI